MVLVLVLFGPGGGFFSLSRRSGLPPRLLPLKPPPGPQKPGPGPQKPTPGLVISPHGTIIDRLRVVYRPLHLRRRLLSSGQNPRGVATSSYRPSGGTREMHRFGRALQSPL